MDKLRYGLVGVGVQGKTYAKFLTEGKIEHGTLGGLCDIAPEVIEYCKENYPEIPIFTDYKEMIKSGKVDAVITTVPHYLHPEIGIYAIEHKVNALVEKPAGVYTKQVAKLNEVARANKDVAFGIMFNQRMNPLYQKLKEIVESGDIGEIRRTNWIITTWWRPQSYYNQSSWRATWEGEGGGVLVNQAPHQLDLFQWICGMPVKVYSKNREGFQRDIAVEDEVTALFEYENGAVGSFITCTHDILGTDRLEIHGDKGKIIVENSNKIIIRRLHKPEQELNKEMTMMEVARLMMGGKLDTLYSEEIIEIPDQWGVQHCLVMDNFAKHVLNGDKLIANGEEGIRGVSLANAIQLSSWLGKEISLPIDEELYLSELENKIELEKQGK